MHFSEEELNHPKFQQLTETANELFNKYGIRKVTIEEICKQANVSKMTFYKFFKNKTDISRTVMDLMMKDGMARYHKLMAEPISFRKKMEKLLVMKMENSKMFSEDFLRDIMEQNLDMQNYLAEKLQENQMIYLELLELGKKEGVFRKDILPEFFLYTLHNLLVMLKDPKLKQIIPDARGRSMELTKVWFYGMFDIED